MDFGLSEKQKKFLAQVDGACKELRPYEEECYLAEKLNDKVVPTFSKAGMLGGNYSAY